jgi:type II secretory pathway component PulF
MDAALDLLERWFVMLGNFVGSSMERILETSGFVLGWLAMLAVLLVVLYAIWVDLSSSLRRHERLRLFLRVLEIGLEQGRSPEDTVVSLAQGRDTSMGIDFHLLAAHVEEGMKLSGALEETPQFLPASVRAMLRAGEELSDLRRVLPACRQALDDALCRTHTVMNGLMTLMFVSPFGPVVAWMVSVWVGPKFELIMQDMAPGEAVPLTSFLDASLVVGGVVTTGWLALWLWGCIQGGAARAAQRLLGNWLPSFDRLQLALPWRRKRLHRDFSVMLSLLLDVGVPEERALRLAGDATANRVLQRRVGRVAAALREGAPLPEAVRRLEDAEEFHWRLRNAAQSGGFTRALAGWHDTLAARAFREEQMASQIVTTAFVILNGLMVGLVVAGVFQSLVRLMEGI